MLILVINCGSSSLKYQLFNIKTGKPVTKGVIERIGEKSSGCRNHHDAVSLIKDSIASGPRSFIEDIGEIQAIGHRVVHGGEDFGEAALISKKVLNSIRKFVELAPLHNPPALAGIKACAKYFPGIPQVAVFDTAFHQTMPDYAYIYGLPYRLYKKYKIRKYGFHGTSHRYVAGIAAEKLGKPIGKLKIITAHLGNGCSMAAVMHGKSVDTTMGLTPLPGLLMGTRTGDLDPAAVTFIMEKKRLGISGVNDLLNKKSGFLGVSGISNDMRDILSGIRKGNYRSRLAYNIFAYGIKKYIGAYAAAMGGLDAVVFTGGIGENMPKLKQALSRELRAVVGEKVKFLTIPTNEELLIARDAYRLTK